MIQTAAGRLPRAVALAALALLFAFLTIAPQARAQAPFGNVVTVVMPAPRADEVVLARVRVEMRRHPGRVAQNLGALRVRRVGGPLPRGYGIAAVRARPRGSVVTVRLAAVRSSSRAARRSRLRLRLRIGDASVVFRRSLVSTVAINPDTDVRGTTDCATISAEAARWSPVGRLAGLALGGERFGARTAVGAAQEIACEKDIRSVPNLAAQAFLAAVHPEFLNGSDTAIEGFYATWAKNPDGSARICVFVRGEPGGTGDVTVGTTAQQFALDDRGLTRTTTAVPGEGEYLFTVRWRQSDGTFRETESTLRVPAGGTRGQGPPPPYSRAGTC